MASFPGVEPGSGLRAIPRYLPHQEFWLSITAYFTLMVGNLVKGL